MKGIYFSNKNFNKSQKVYHPPRVGAMLIEQHIYVDSFVVDVLSSMRFHEYLIGFIRLSKVIVHRELLWKAKKK